MTSYDMEDIEESVIRLSKNKSLSTILLSIYIISAFYSIYYFFDQIKI